MHRPRSPLLRHCAMSAPPSTALAKGAPCNIDNSDDAETGWTTDKCINFLLPNTVDLTTIQDVGKISTKSDSREIVYPLVKKLAGKFYDHFRDNGFPNLPANKSRTTDVITMMIINMRKHLDKALVREDFRSTKSIADCQKIYIICNDDTEGRLLSSTSCISTGVQSCTEIK